MTKLHSGKVAAEDDFVALPAADILHEESPQEVWRCRSEALIDINYFLV